MNVAIEPLLFRDCCYIAANIRDEDWNECRCQLENENKFELASLSYFSTVEDLRWCLRVNGQPTAAMGLGKTGPTLCQAWMWGTKHMNRGFPTMIRFLNTSVRQNLLERGVLRVEVRALETHEFVRRGWIARMGARDCGLMRKYGKNGEDFRLYAWWKGMEDYVFL